MNPAYAAYVRRYRPSGRGAAALALTLYRLAERANHAGAVDALSVRELAGLIGLGERQVQRVLSQLEHAGKIAREAQFAGRARIENRIRLLAEWVQAQLEHAAPSPTWRAWPRIYANGGCTHNVPACEACRAEAPPPHVSRLDYDSVSV